MAEVKAVPARPWHRRKWPLLVGALVCAGAVTTTVLVAGTGDRTLPYDFNGDGKPDIVIGLPGNAVSGHIGAGSIVVANGTSTGATGTKVRIDQATEGFPASPEAGDGFGHAFASGDFDNDGYADLAVSSPTEAIGTTQGAGLLSVHYGTSGGIHGTRTDAYNEDTTSYPGAVGWDEIFAYSLAAGDLNNDGYDDLAVGQPLDHAGGAANAGSVKVMLGSAGGLSAAATHYIDQSTSRVPGTPEAEDRFGEQLAVGDVNGDGTGDLIVATMGEQIAGSSDRGAIHVLFGPFDSSPASSAYLDAGRVDGIGEFAGSALTVGRFNGDDYLDVAIGVSDEKVGDSGAAGRLAVLYADAQGLSAARVSVFDQGTPGISGSPETEDYFASSLAAGDFDGDGIDDIVAGMRSEKLGTATGAGASMVLFGSAEDGVSTSGAVWIDQDTAGVPGVVATDDHFGWTVGALDTDGNGRTEALIGAPGNAAGTVTVVKVRPGTMESATVLSEESMGWAAGTNGDAFGIALPRP
ncbi:FG-GAP and VCBS repeat-containing protein [Streptomyces sp. NPDC007002]|uniref:FG-GAP and VCBS repeat-containing protein n=1 Tax=Streptomyces sp. NPDC007002 TaxID=3156910 RepID=UPI0034515FB8